MLYLHIINKGHKNMNKCESDIKKFNCLGLGVALITPFHEDMSVDYDGLGRVIDHIIAGGADYIVALGTTAETPTLSPTERREVRKFIVDHVGGRIPVVLGIGGNCTRRVVDDIREADLDDYSALLSVAPYYNKPTQQGIYLHFAEIAKASPLPVLLYNIPGRTGVNIEPETCLRLARDFKNIVGVKEASGRLKQIEEIIDNKPDGFNVISGDDSLTYSLIKMGASGVISVAGNAFPQKFGKMVRACLDGNFEEARKIDIELSGLYEELFRDGNPAGIKCMLHAMGLIKNILRLPLVPTCEETDAHLREILEELK